MFIIIIPHNKTIFIVVSYIKLISLFVFIYLFV